MSAVSHVHAIAHAGPSTWNTFSPSFFQTQLNYQTPHQKPFLSPRETDAPLSCSHSTQYGSLKSAKTHSPPNSIWLCPIKLLLGHLEVIVLTSLSRMYTWKVRRGNWYWFFLFYFMKYSWVCKDPGRDWLLFRRSPNILSALKINFTLWVSSLCRAATDLCC